MMNLLEDKWIKGVTADGSVALISPLDVSDQRWVDIYAERPDFRGGIYQFLIGALQLACAPEDTEEWRDRLNEPPEGDDLKAAFSPYQHAFLLESEAGKPAFMQDLDLPDDANRLSVRELLIDAGSDSNLYFNKPVDDFCLCERCAAQALFTLQINAPSGGRGVRTSLRGGGPLTTLLAPAERQKPASLWQKLWLNVLPTEVLGYEPVKGVSAVLPWLTKTRTSDGTQGVETTPESVHPLQAYWSMPRRIRLVVEDKGTKGCCSLCGATAVRVFHQYQTRHGGTNYTGAWLHPLTPYKFDPKGEEVPISCKGREAGKGYREWVGLVLGNEDQQPDAAQVVKHFNRIPRRPEVRLWCFGYAMDNMKAQCWYESWLPVTNVDASLRARFVQHVKIILDSAEAMASLLNRYVRTAWFKRPADAGQEPAVPQSFWQRSEEVFYRSVFELSRAQDLERVAAYRPVYEQWLKDTRNMVLRLFDEWVLNVPVEDMDLRRVVKARADLLQKLWSDKDMKAVVDVVSGGEKKAGRATKGAKKQEADA